MMAWPSKLSRPSTWFFLAVSLVLLVVPSSPASAHSQLIGTDPDHGAIVDGSPDQIRLSFNQPIRLISDGIVVSDSAGGAVPGEWRLDGLNAVFGVESPIAEGTVVVTWRVISEDGHPVSGVLIFHVGVVTDPDAGDIVAVRPIGSVVANAVMYLGLLVGGGVALFLAHIHDGGRDWLMLKRLAALLLGLGLVAVVVSLLAKTVETTGSFNSELMPPGWIGMVVLAVSGCGLALLGLDRNRKTLITVGVGLALASLVLVGHTRSFSPTSVMYLADLVHVGAGAVWVGGLVAVAIVCRQRRRYLSSDTPMVQPATGMILRFSSIAGWTLLAVLLSGSALAWTIHGGPTNLLDTTHGRLILLKLGIVVAVGLVGALNRFKVVPAVAKAASVGTYSRLATTTTVEAFGLVLLLVATAGLVEQDPRVAQVPLTAQGPVQVSFGDHTLTLDLDPGVVGVNQVVLRVSDSSGQDIELAAAPRLAVIDGDQRTSYETEPTEVGYVTTVTIPDSDRLVLEVRGRIGTFEEAVALVEFSSETRRMAPTAGLLVTNPRLPLLTGLPTSVVYMEVVSALEDQIVGVESTACLAVTLHETVISSDGSARMEPRQAIPLAALTPVVFDSGSLHVMCVGLDEELVVGDSMPLTLRTEAGHAISIVVPIVDYSEVLN